MSAFVIMLHDDDTSNDELRSSIEKTYPGSSHYKFSDFVYLVTGPRLVSDITHDLGFDDDGNEKLYAAILRLNGSYSGRSWIKLWDWLQAAEQAR